MNKKLAIGIIGATMCAAPAHAWQYNSGPVGFSLTGYGNVGIFEPDFDTPDFVGDWKIRTQVDWRPNNDHMFAIVYSLDQQSVRDGIDDLFAIWQIRNIGRIELGMTDSVAGKLGLGIPDVGGLRMNDNPLVYKYVKPRGPVIADPTVDSEDWALRLNLTSVPGRVQYGVSVASVTPYYDYALDAGVKFRDNAGKLKNALSVGASFISHPDGFSDTQFSPNITADWRAQVAVGFNMQYNSWIWGISARAIYDMNPIGPVSDGIVAGTGVSYDILNYSVSAMYLFSDTGIWHHGVPSYADHTAMASFRYKYSANIDGWISAGVTTTVPFVAAGVRLTF